MERRDRKTVFESLKQKAILLGATDADIIDASKIINEERLAKYCKDPGCENYGTSAGCPPYVKGPEAFREFLKDCEHALVFKIEVPAAVFYSYERQEVFTLLHQTSAGIEKHAVDLGYSNSMAFVSGGCRNLFCFNEPDCSVLSGGECRHPDSARPSMSGYGVNVSELVGSAGWKMNWAGKQSGFEDDKIGTAVGLVLLKPAARRP